MSGTREILTFQFGNYSNYIGTHWWNIQESGFSYESQCKPSEINNDVFYREGVNLNRQTTYTPRLLLVEFDSALKHLPREGELYGNSIKRTPNATPQDDAVKKLKKDLEWHDTDVEVIEQPEAVKNDFQKDLDDGTVDFNEKDYSLAENVNSWVDFLYSRYHPRTVNGLNQYKHALDEKTFGTNACGLQVWQTEEFKEEFCDKIRRYVEECDFLQGFQTIFDCYNGYAGLTTQCLEYLNDEYINANMVVPVFAPKNVLFHNGDEAISDSLRAVNSALAFSHLTEYSSLFVPLSTQDRVWRQLGSTRSFPSLQFQADNYYQTSAVLAAYLDTISLRYRLKDSPSSSSLSGFCGDMTNYGRKMAAAAFALPFQLQHDEDLIDCLEQRADELFTQLTPNCKIGTNYIIQSVCMRGIRSEQLKRTCEQGKPQTRPTSQLQRQMCMNAYKYDTVSEMLQFYFQCKNHASLAHISAIESPMPTRMPFPRDIFATNVNAAGFQTPLILRNANEFVNSVPTLAAIQSSSDLSDTLGALHREAKRVKIAKMGRLMTAGLEEDDYEAALENLLLFKDNYDDNFEL